MSMIIMFMVMFYPDACHVIFSSLSCRVFEGQSRYWYDLNLICFQESHRDIIIFLTTPGIIFWVIGLPVYLSWVIYNNSKELQLDIR